MVSGYKLVYHLVRNFDIHHLTAPSSPPVDVVLTAINSHTLSITWNPPPIDQRNGIIREYMVTVTEVTTEMTMNYTSDSTSLTLSSLHPFYTYYLTLAAYTIQYGPSSAVFNITMPEDGKYKFLGVVPIFN